LRYRILPVVETLESDVRGFIVVHGDLGPDVEGVFLREAGDE